MSRSCQSAATDRAGKNSLPCQCYEDTLQAAYDAMTRVEDALSALGMKLEYEHFRLGGAVDELQPLMIHPRSKSEKVMEILVEKMPALDSNADHA